MKVVRRDPSFGYVDTWLWVPKTYINVDGTKQSLTHVIVDRYAGNTKVIHLFREAPHHLLVPRAFWRTEDVLFPVVDCRPREYTRVDFTSRVQLDHRVQADEQGNHVLLPTGDNVQQLSFDAMSNAMGGVLQLACGKGKGQPLHEVVMTPSGPRAIGDIRVGAYVLGSDGKPTRVIGVFPQGVRPVYRVSFSDETSVLCDEDHLWRVCYDRRKDKVVRTGDILGKLRTKAGPLYAVPYAEAAQTETSENLPLDPWLLGAWLGDGHKTTFTNEEQDLQRKFIRPAKPDSARARKRPDRCGDVYVKSHGDPRSQSVLQQSLQELGLWDTSSSSKFIPRRYLDANPKVRMKLLRGLCDTDGSVTNQKRTIEYTTVSELLAKDVEYLVRSLGGRVSTRSRKTKYTYKGEKRTGQLSYRLRITFPAGGVTPVSSKKHLAKWDSTPGQRTKKYIESIEYVGDEETVCIKVSAKDQCYLTKDFTVTHNTPTTLHFIAEQKVPALVMLDNAQLLEQWRQEAEAFLDIPGGIGYIAAGKREWQRSLVLGTYTSVANWVDDMPEEVRRWFGGVYWDEGHHLSAPVFSKTAAAFYGRRYCLTATPERDDGLHIIADMHVGKVLHKDLTQPLKARFIFYWTGLSLDLTDPNCTVLDKNGELHASKVFRYFGKWQPRLYRLIQDAVDAVSQGRKVLVVGNSVDEVVNLMCIWTYGTNANLITDIPYPTPSDVGESDEPLELSPVEAKKLEKALETQKRRFDKLSKENASHGQLYKVNQRIIELETDWKRYEVYKKCERLNEKHRKEFIKDLVEAKSSAGFMVYGVPAQKRQEFVRTRDVTFAIMKYGKEGLDAPHLDTILVSSPFSNRGGLQQLMGRITGRPKPGKKKCIVVFYRDDVGPCHGMCKNLEKHLRNWPVDEGGPFDFESINNPLRKSWQKAPDLKTAFGQ